MEGTTHTGPTPTFLEVTRAALCHDADPLGDISSLSLHACII